MYQTCAESGSRYLVASLSNILSWEYPIMTTNRQTLISTGVGGGGGWTVKKEETLPFCHFNRSASAAGPQPTLLNCSLAVVHFHPWPPLASWTKCRGHEHDSDPTWICQLPRPSRHMWFCPPSRLSLEREPFQFPVIQSWALMGKNDLSQKKI
jgi:hypothetical protein